MGTPLLSCILFACSFLALLRSYDATPPSSAGATGPDAEPPAYVAPQVGLKEADRILALVDQPKGNSSFSQYAGYVTVDPKHGRTLFYYFVESPTEPTKKPLVLWLTGGPGCSSLGYGAMSQVGPFRVNSHRKLYENPYALNKVANVIFLESPAGVGFSYSNTTSDYELSGDKRTAQDSHTFLVNWLERYLEYKNRDFYMAGSSYSGHYIPQLAKLILLEFRGVGDRWKQGIGGASALVGVGGVGGGGGGVSGRGGLLVEGEREYFIKVIDTVEGQRCI